MSKNAITVRNVSKSFRQYKSNWQKIQFLLMMRDAGTKIEVLKDVSFDIKKGEKVGIIGQQQSGKTTLLRIIAKIIRPDSGKVRVAGGVTPILDIRMGFDSSLSGKDNYIIMNNAFGRSAAETKASEDEVFKFAGLSRLKNEPLKTYPKGSASKLGFAIATGKKDDIILFDASITFGEKAWNTASMERMQELVSGDTTLVMSVNKLADAEQLCNRGLVLHQGRLVYDGAFGDAIDYYRNNCKRNKKHKEKKHKEKKLSDRKNGKEDEEEA